MTDTQISPAAGPDSRACHPTLGSGTVTAIAGGTATIEWDRTGAITAHPYAELSYLGPAPDAPLRMPTVPALAPGMRIRHEGATYTVAAFSPVFPARTRIYPTAGPTFTIDNTTIEYA